jgi:hypothetical protein
MMLRPTSRPRPDHVAELTRGIAPPLRAISEMIIGVIAEALSEVWLELSASHPSVLQSGSEAEVSDLLVSRLNRLCTLPGLWSQLVTSVVRGRECLSYNGGSLERRPDLSVYLTGLHPSFPLNVECKIINRADGRSIGLYCSEGLRRFVEGQYAWANREGLMLGYVRDGSTISKHLLRSLSRTEGEPSDPFATLELPTSKPNFRVPTYASKHERRFRYLDGGVPGSITVFHLWLASPRTPS